MNERINNPGSNLEVLPPNEGSDFEGEKPSLKVIEHADEEESDEDDQLIDFVPEILKTKDKKIEPSWAPKFHENLEELLRKLENTGEISSGFANETTKLLNQHKKEQEQDSK